MTVAEKFLIQDGQYGFPYHWLPQFLPGGEISTCRSLFWGLEYLSYMEMAADRIARCRPGSVLDVGCGDGRLSEFLLRRTAVEYHGVDLSEKAIEFAKALNPTGRFDCMDVGGLAGKYDVVSMVEVLEHIPDDQVGTFLGGVSAALRDSGTLVISVPTTNRPRNRKHYRHYDLASLKRQLEPAGFEVKDSEYCYRIGAASRLCEKLLVNKIYSLNPSAISKAIWSIHRAVSYRASESTGAHLLVSAVKAGSPAPERTPSP